MPTNSKSKRSSSLRIARSRVMTSSSVASEAKRDDCSQAHKESDDEAHKKVRRQDRRVAAFGLTGWWCPATQPAGIRFVVYEVVNGDGVSSHPGELAAIIRMRGLCPPHGRQGW